MIQQSRWSSDLSLDRSEARMPLKFDFPLCIALWLLIGLGLLVLYSASDRSLSLVIRQGVAGGIGTLLMLVVARTDPRHFVRIAPYFYGGALVLLVLVLFVGVGAKNTNRWISLGFVSFQPSELMRLALPVATAAYLVRHPLPIRFVQILVVCLLTGAAVGLVFIEPDLGTSTMVALAGLFVLFLAGLHWQLIGYGLLSGLILLPIIWFRLLPYQRGRILTLFNPEADPLGAGWNIMQSKAAIGSGGLTGKGFMNGTQGHLDFLPESHTDFIFAVLAEELGFVGVLMLLGLYAFILIRCMAIAINARDTFGRLLAGSLTLVFAAYVVVNMGMVMGLLPVVGVPLPLVSQGGTSLVTMLVGFGALMSVAVHR